MLDPIFFLFLSLLPQSRPSLSAPSPSKPSRFSEKALLDHARVLASDGLMGRRAGSPAERVAAAYISLQLERSGLKPLGAGGFERAFEVARGYELAGVPRLSLAGGPTFSFGEDFTVLPHSGSGKLEGEVLFCGYGLSFEGGHGAEFEWDDFEGKDVKGRIALLVEGSPDLGGVKLKDSVSRKIYTAKAKGASALLLLLGGDGLPARKPSRSSSGIPALAVRRGVLTKALPGLGKILEEFEATGKAGNLQGHPRASLDLRLEKKMAAARNVVGFLPGGDPALRDEYVVLGAHFDHLGLGGEGSLAPGGGVGLIHNGADDNASGVSVALEVARELAQGPPLRRSVLVALFSGEEMGLLGSRHLVENPPVPLEKIVAMVNLDMVGRSKEGFVAVLGSETSSFFPELLKSIDGGASIRTGGSPIGGSDHQSFIGKGIPSLFFFTGTHSDYHRPTDDSEKLNGPGMARIANTAFELMRRLTALDRRPDFIKPKPRAMGTPANAAGARPYLGTIPDYVESENGVQLSGVTPGSPAEAAGIKAGDILIHIAGKKIDNIYDFSYALRELVPGRKIKIKVRRKGKVVELEATVGSR